MRLLVFILRVRLVLGEGTHIGGWLARVPSVLLSLQEIYANIKED